MKRIAWAGALTWVVATAVPAGGQDAEKKLPEFSLRTAGGDAVSATYEGGALAVARKDAAGPIRAVLLHFFQPDCNACRVEMKALEGLHKELSPKGALVAGVAHRGDEASARDVAKQLALTYPLLLGQGSELAKAFSRGDATVIADNRGRVRFSQVGFKDGDEKTFRRTIEDLLGGKAVLAETNERRRLAVGETFPAVRLPALLSGKPLSMTVEDGKLTYRDETGKASHPKAAVGFFSRY